MQTRRHVLGVALGLAMISVVPANAQQKLKVVASFSILGDITKQVGGEHIELKTLVGPDGDAHVYQPTPADARKVGEADVLIVNGLAFESWLDRLAKAARFHGKTVVASAGVKALPFEEGGHDHDEHAHKDNGHKHEEKSAHKHDEKDHKHAEDHDHDKRDHRHDEKAEHGHNHSAEDPHAWQSLANGVIYVRNIVEGLSAADPTDAAEYKERGEAYIAELQKLDSDARAKFGAIPESDRVVVTSHDAFGYFGEAYGIRFIAPEGISTEAEASAADVAKIIGQIREDKIRAVFVENITDKRMINQIAQESGASVGGTLYSDALSGPEGPAATYAAMFQNNVEQLVKALKK